MLAATGEGIEIEEPRAWQGYWNETVAELCRLSMKDSSTLNVLLTGRKENGFSDLIGRMIASKGLEFDMVCLKPATGPNGEKFNSTMTFKQALLSEIVYTYRDAEEIKIYEDRPKHTAGFRNFFTDLNSKLMSIMDFDDVQRTPITAEVVQVSDQESLMDPVQEVSEVQRMINVHNQAIHDGAAPPGSRPYKIKRSVFYTGYLISAPDIEKLKSLIKLPSGTPDHEIKYLANNILIVPRPAPPSILKKVGGMGAKVVWKVVGTAVLEGRVWAAKVQPAVPGTKYHTENPTPCVVLATRRNAKPIDANLIRNWQPVAEQFEFETTVGEKVLLRIEEERQDEDEYEASFPNARNARKHTLDDDFPPLGSERPAKEPHSRGGRGGAQNGHGGGWGGNRANAGGIGFAAHRGGANSGRGGGRGNPNTGGFRGRGGRGSQRGRGRGGYRSLDDNVGQGYGGGSMQY